MKPTTTTGFIATGMENPAFEIEDFEQLVAQHRVRIRRFLFASLRDMDLAESLTQDCLWKAYRHRKQFRGDSTVQTWLLRIAINLLRDHTRSRRFQFWRKTKRVQNDEIRKWADQTISPEERTGIREQVEAIREATHALSERQRTVFLLRYVEDLDIREIAQSTGLTESTVNAHLTRAVHGIRKRMGDRK